MLTINDVILKLEAGLYETEFDIMLDLITIEQEQEMLFNIGVQYAD
jgi:hypothetical protein